MLWSNFPYPINGGAENDMARMNDNIEQNNPFNDGQDVSNQKLWPRLIIISLITDMITVPTRADIPKISYLIIFCLIIN